MLVHKCPWAACRQDKHGHILLPQLATIPDGRVSEELCQSASTMANQLGAAAIFAYTRRGYMANFLSRCRPDCPIFAFTGMLLLHLSDADALLSYSLPSPRFFGACLQVDGQGNIASHLYGLHVPSGAVGHGLYISSHGQHHFRVPKTGRCPHGHSATTCRGPQPLPSFAMHDHAFRNHVCL